MHPPNLKLMDTTNGVRRCGESSFGKGKEISNSISEGPSRTISKRFAPSDPSAVDKARSKRKMDSSVCHSDSSSDPCEESDFNLMAPLPLTYAPAAPILIGPASSVVDDDLTEWRRRYSGTNPAPAEGESTVLRARQLPLDRRQVNFLVSETALLRSSLWSKYVSSHILCLFLVPDGSFCTWNMSGSIVNDPFAAHQEAAKVMSAIKGSASRTTSGDEVVITGSRRKTMVKVEPSFSSQGKKSKAGDFEGFLGPDPFRVYTEDWSPKQSSVGEARYLNLLLDSPSLAGVF
ncbi:hypothetical protein Bca52824_048199 [Brassica carinata]|uniref:Uncharacterized protein n=1 Tax=Brassica carinata TaxID=52824 RepID=A0A8X7RKP7_BRACI|nr:hypothetical protein Bca52824_048199 [Brassica carinata]